MEQVCLKDCILRSSTLIISEFLKYGILYCCDRRNFALTNERDESDRSQNESTSTYVGHHYALYITALYIKLISGKTTLTYYFSLTLYLLIDAKINRYSITLPCRNGKCSKSLRLMPINDLRYSFVKIIFVKNSILDFRKKSKIR